MAETIKGEKLIDWACRIFITLDILVILAGYFSWFQTKRELVTPLIPRTLAYQMFSDGGDTHFKNSVIAALIFLPGLWLYSFQKKTFAVIFFIAPVLLFLVENMLLRM